MNIKNKKNKKLTFILIGTALLLTVAIGAFWYNLHNKASSEPQTASKEATRDVNTVNYEPAKEADNIAEKSAKEQLAESGTDSQPTNNPLGVSITSAQQQDQTVLIRTLVDGTSSGTCTMTASKAGQQALTKNAPINTQASYSICQGFNIPSSEFSSAGEWSFEVKVSANGATATSKQVRVEVKK